MYLWMFKYACMHAWVYVSGMPKLNAKKCKFTDLVATFIIRYFLLLIK
jgi:hypothetical protein